MLYHFTAEWFIYPYYFPALLVIVVELFEDLLICIPLLK